MTEKTPTSTKTITKLGVLTVLMNVDLPPLVHEKVKRELKFIAEGKTHVPTWKVRDRLLERCLIGGAAIGYELNGIAVPGITGLN